jgi:RNA polymerase sigma-70 factor (ECF subfamily)
MSDRLKSDEELMTAYQSGDDQAFNELYRRYSGRVYGFLAGKNLAGPARDEVFQEIFLKFHKSRSLYSSPLPLVPWLFAICRSVLLDHFKVKGPSIVHSETAEPTRPAEGDTRLAFERALENIPPAQREALRLRFLEGLDFSVISARLDTSPPNARQLISRALKRLRKEL